MNHQDVPNTPANALQEILRRNVEERASVVHPQTQQDQQPQQPEQRQQRQPRSTFYDHVMHTFFEGDEEEMLNSLAFNSLFFFSVLNLVDSVPLQRRGRPGFIRTHKDKLLFLVIFLKEGMGTLKRVCLPVLTEASSITRNLDNSLTAFKDVIIRNSVEFKREHLDELPTISSVIDCTVVEISGPAMPFKKKDKYYSGKHKRHCLKKEVIVNIRSGTAAMISEEYPGSFSDIEILKRHPEQVNQMLGVTHMLADKGYRGDPHVPNLIVVPDGDEIQKRARLIVERFFGRLKNSFIVFSMTRELAWERFSDYFDVACALTNSLITISPLNYQDWQFNQKVYDKWARQVQQRAARNKEKYERKKTMRLQQREAISSTMSQIL